MDKKDRIDWLKFTSVVSQKITSAELRMISELHAKYFNHKMKIPCTCSPKRIQVWIEDLNKLYNEV